MRTPDVIRIFVGWDPNEPVAYHVCCESIIRHTSRPVQITPLALNTVKSLYVETHTDGSNQFVYSRFLVPWLCSWQGHAIFLDGDMLLRGDIAELWDLKRYDVGAQVVQHDYKTKYPRKYMGAKNENYPAKNWSSVILWNCGYSPNRVLTPQYVGEATGETLHRFQWLQPEKVGALPAEFNHLTMEYAPNPSAKIAHYTVGTPCFEGYEAQEHAQEWFDTLNGMLAPLRSVF